MDKDKLMDLLGVKPKSKEDGLELINRDMGVHGDHTTTLEVSDTCFNIDQWEEEQGLRLLKSLNTTGLSLTSKKVADLFAASYRQYPEVEHCCTDRNFQKFVETLLESPDFKVLHESTRANLMASDMAAVQFAEQYAKVEQEAKKINEKFSGTMADQKVEMVCMRAAGQAIAKAQMEIDYLEDMQRALGCGSGGSADNQIDTAQTIKVFNQIKNNWQLRRIIELAGRYRLMAQAKQRMKVSHGYDDMIGVVMDGDISRLLPLELAMLSDEDFELDAMRRLVERQSMCREYRGVEPQGKGPIVICVDESGSMSGEKICNAKAFALSMYWIAKHQNRWCWLVSFSDFSQIVYGTLIPPNKPEPRGLVNWLQHFFNGGTHLQVPLVEVPKRWEQCPKGRTDMVIITDEELYLNDDMRDEFLKFKEKEKVKLTSIVLGAGGGPLKAVSDDVFCTSGINVDSDAVSKCFSI